MWRKALGTGLLAFSLTPAIFPVNKTLAADKVELSAYGPSESQLSLEERYAGVIRAAAAGNIPALEAFRLTGIDLNRARFRGMTVLTAVVRNMHPLGQEETIDYLLNQGVDINGKDNEGKTALMHASMKGALTSYEDIVRQLLARGADPNVKDNEGLSALMHTAAWGDKIENQHIVSMLLDKGAEINAKSDSGTTPLAYAAQNGNVNVVQFLLSKGADPAITDVQGRNAVMDAVAFGVGPRHEIVELLLKYFPAYQIDARDRNGETALMLAVLRFKDKRDIGSKKVARLLMDHKADVNSRNNRDFTVLMNAVLHNIDTDIVQDLLKHGADVNARNKFGWTALMYAVMKNSVDMVATLLEAGADGSVRENDGKTALFLAQDQGFKDIVKLLKGQRLFTAEEKDAFLQAAADGNTSKLKRMLEQGMDANTRVMGNTALINASMEGHLEAVRLLLENKADTEIKDSFGNTALWYAEENGYREIAKLIKAQQPEITDDEKKALEEILRQKQ